VDEPLYCFNVTQLVRSEENIPLTEKLNDHIAFRLTCKIYDKKSASRVRELDNDTILGDDFITFECQRIDIY
jgi:hypothetical protein